MYHNPAHEANAKHHLTLEYVLKSIDLRVFFIAHFNLLRLENWT